MMLSHLLCILISDRKFGQACDHTAALICSAGGPASF